MPWHWYLTSALPRAQLLAFPLAVVAPVVDPRVMRLVGPVALFVAAYSLLPHKELRFIIYAVPVANVAAATVLVRAYVPRSDGAGRPVRRRLF